MNLTFDVTEYSIRKISFVHYTDFKYFTSSFNGIIFPSKRIIKIFSFLPVSYLSEI